MSSHRKVVHLMSRVTSPSRSRIARYALAAIAIVVTLLLFMFQQSNVTAAIKQTRTERLNARIENVYSTGFQQMRHDELIEERDAESHGIDNIFVKDDPYCTNTRALYVYFVTDQPSSVTYTVSAEGYPDFSADPYQGEDMVTEHEFLVLGLLPDVTNTITLTITDDTGDSTTRVIEHEGLGLLGAEEVVLERTVEPQEGTDLGGRPVCDPRQ